MLPPATHKNTVLYTYKPLICTHRLEELDLTNNALTSLPPELGLLTPGRGGALRALLLQGNCIRTVRRPLLEGGTGALLDYLLTRLPADA